MKILKSKPVLFGGHYNGYVAIDRSHKFFGKSYDDYVKVDNAGEVKGNGNSLGVFLLDEKKFKNNELTIDLVINVHGGITYSEKGDSQSVIGKAFNESIDGMWVFGFDTAHFGDTIKEWTEEKTAKEIDKLYNELKKFGEVSEMDTIEIEVPEDDEEYDREIMRLFGGETDILTKTSFCKELEKDDDGTRYCTVDVDDCLLEKVLEKIVDPKTDYSFKQIEHDGKEMLLVKIGDREMKIPRYMTEKELIKILEK